MDQKVKYLRPGENRVFFLYLNVKFKTCKLNNKLLLI